VLGNERRSRGTSSNAAWTSPHLNPVHGRRVSTEDIAYLKVWAVVCVVARLICWLYIHPYSPLRADGEQNDSRGVRLGFYTGNPSTGLARQQRKSTIFISSGRGVSAEVYSDIQW